MKRRDFVKLSALASGSLFVPAFLRPFETSADALGLEATGDGKILVIVQFSGGNDGLNTIIPTRNDIYYKSRPKLAIPKQEALRLTDETGLHPKMVGIKELYDEGLMAIAGQVGYPNQDRSHFRSMDIWQSASSADDTVHTGWVGRYLDNVCAGPSELYKTIELDGQLSLALKGDNYSGLAMQKPGELYRQSQTPSFEQIVGDLNSSSSGANAETQFMYKTLIGARSSVKYIGERFRVQPSKMEYPQTLFAARMKTIASMIRSGIPTRVYYVTLATFDTHSGQAPRQGKLLEQYSEAMKVFMKDLKGAGRLDDVLVMTFSEFGRRVVENGSAGTDHGRGNNVFLMGGGLKKKGLLNAQPPLTNLKDGDIPFALDYRDIYSTVLRDWLEIAPEKVLGSAFKPMDFI
jgi:uncharacterized protein (DUF1501 family)